MYRPEEMIKRLKPLLGPHADALWNTYLASDPEERLMLRRLLENLHAQWVDDYTGDKIILTPPSTFEQVYGDYPAGMVWYGDKPLYPFAFLEKELVQHIGVFGRTGAGKSYFVKGLLHHLLHKKPVLILDWKGTYTDLLDRDMLLYVPGSSSFPFLFNPLDLEGIEQEYHKAYMRQVIELFLDCYLRELKLLTTQGVEYLLLLCVDELRSRKASLSFQDVFDWMCRFNGSFREMDWRTSALNLLYKLTNGPLGKVMRSETLSISRLLSQKTLLELSNTGSTKDKSFFIRTLLLRIYYHFQQQGASDTMKLFIVIEEAHNVLLKKGSGYETIVELMLRQIREFGVGVCVVDQHPSLVSLPALGTYCTVAFSLRLRQDRDAMASALSLREVDYLARLPSRFAIVKIQDRFLTPFLIRTFDVKQGSKPSVTQLKRNQEESLSESGRMSSTEENVIRDVREEEEAVRGFSKVVRANSGVVRAIRDATNREGKTLLWEEVFLIHIYTYPLQGAVQRYRQLDLNRYQGNKQRTSLLDKGLIALEPVPTSSGRIMLMVPTKKGFQWLGSRGFTTASDKAGGIEHRYWKRRLRDRFRSEGFAVGMEVKIGGNSAIDLLISNGVNKVSVEIETGNNTYEQMQKNITKAREHADGVVCLMLLPHKAAKLRELANGPNVSIVSDESECVHSAIKYLGDII